MSEDQIKMLRNMGALGYSDPKKILMVMRGAGIGIADEGGFVKDFANKNSEVWQIWNEGKEYSEYRIDLKLHEMSLAGDIKAIDKLNSRKRLR